jgi:hypothetical protein
VIDITEHHSRALMKADVPLSQAEAAGSRLAKHAFAFKMQTVAAPP